MAENPKISVADFAIKIREKHPGAYDHVDDDTLVNSVLKKHPVYRNRVEIPVIQDEVLEGSGVVIEQPTNPVVQRHLPSYTFATQVSDEEASQVFINEQTKKKERFEGYDGMTFKSNAHMALVLGDDYEDYIEYLETGAVKVSQSDVSRGINGLIEQKGDAYLEEIPDSERRIVNEYLIKNEITDDEEETIFNVYEAKQESYGNTLTELLTQRGAAETDEDRLEIQKKINVLKRQNRAYNRDFVGVLDTLNREDIAKDLFGRSYRGIDKLYAHTESAINSLGQFGLDVLETIDLLGDEAFKSVYSLFGIDITPEQADVLRGATPGTQNINAQFFEDVQEKLTRRAINNENYIMYGLEKPVQFDDAFDSWENFFEWAGETVISQSPYLMMAFTGQAALPLFFASGAGEKSLEYEKKDFKYSDEHIQGLREKLNNAEYGSKEYLSILEELNQATHHRSVSKIARAMNILSYGAAEAVFERFGTLAILKDIRAAYRISRKAGGSQALKRVLKEKFGNFHVPKAIAKHTGQEAITEAATTIAQNWADRVFGGENKSLLEGVDEAAGAGALLGFLLGGGGVLSTKIGNVAADQRRKAKITELRDEYTSILLDLEKNKNVEGYLTEDVVDVLSKRKQELEQGSLILGEVVAKNLEALPNESRTRLFELDMISKELNDSLEIIENSNASEASKQASRGVLLSEIARAEAEADALLNHRLTEKELNTLSNISKATNEQLVNLYGKLGVRGSTLKKLNKFIASKVGNNARVESLLKEEADFYEASILEVENALDKLDAEITKRQEATETKQKVKRQSTEAIRTKLKIESEGKQPAKEGAVKKAVKKVTGVAEAEKAIEAEQKIDKELQETSAKAEKAAEDLKVKPKVSKVGVPKKKVTKSEKQKSSILKSYKPVRQGKTVEQRDVEKREKSAMRKAKAGELSKEESAELEQEKQIATKNAETNAKNGKVAEALIDVANDHESNYRKSEEAIKQIGDNITKDNVDDVIDSVIDNTSFDSDRVTLFFMNFNKQVQENQSLSPEDKKYILDKLSSRNITELEIAKLNQLRKDILKDRGDFFINDYLAATAVYNYKTRINDLFSGFKVNDFTSLLHPDANGLKNLKLETEEDIKLFETELVGAVKNAQNTYWKETRGGWGVKNVLPLIPADKLGGLIADVVLRNAGSLVGVNAELNIAHALEDLIMNTPDLKLKVMTDLGLKDKSLSDVFPKKPKKRRAEPREEVVLTKRGERTYIVESDSREFITYKQKMIELGKQILDSVSGLDGVLIKDYGFGRFMNQGTFSIENSEAFVELNKAFNKLGKRVVSVSDVKEDVFKVPGLKTLNVKNDTEFDNNFEVTINEKTYKGWDGLNDLFFNAIGGQTNKGEPFHVFNDYGKTSPARYKIRDGETLKRIVAGAALKKARDMFLDKEVVYKNDKPVNGVSPMANKNPNSGPLSDKSLEVLNYLNSIGLTLDTDVVDYITKKYLDNYQEYKFLDKGYEKEIAEVLEGGFKVGLIAANDHKGQAFFIQHYMDWRSRVYSANTELNYQGIKPFLAMYKLKDKKAIGDSGAIAIFLQAADQYNAMDAKGLMFERDRLQWTMDNIEHIVKFAANPDGYKIPGHSKTMWDEASDKELFFATAREIARMYEWKNNPENADKSIAEFESNLIVWQDATVSGGQHLSLLSRDRYTAALVNLLTSDQRRDLYIKVAERVFNGYKDEDGKEYEGIERLGKGYSKETKKAFMEASEEYNEMYGNYKIEWKDSERDAIRKDMEKRVKSDPEIERIAKLYWGEAGKRELMRTLSKGPVMTSFYNAGAWAMMENLLSQVKTKDAFAEIRDTGEFGGVSNFKLENGNIVKEVDGFRRVMLLWLTSKMYEATKDVAFGPSKTKTFLGKLAKKTFSFKDPDGGTAAIKMEGLINETEIYSKYMKPHWGDTAQESAKIRNRTRNSLRTGNTWNTSKFITEWVRDFSREETAIAPNVVHGMGDAQLPAWEAYYSGRESIFIHDNFGTHAADAKNQVDDLRRVMAYMYEGTKGVEVPWEFEWAKKIDDAGGDFMYLLIDQTLGHLGQDAEDAVTTFKKGWDDVKKAVENRPITSEMREILTDGKNSNWDLLKHLEQNNWAINGATGRNIMHNPIDNTDKQFFDYLTKTDLNNSIKWNNANLADDAKEAVNPCK